MTFIGDVVKRNVGGIHKSARGVARSARAVFNNAAEAEARRLAATIAPSPLLVSDDDGYTSFSCSDLGLEQLFENIRELSERWKEDPSRLACDKEFLIDLLRPQDLVEKPEILGLAMHPVFYGAAAAYLGQTPWLVAVSMWLSPPNNTSVRSQLYHYDHKDMRQFKVFINLNDIDEDCGPLHFLPVQSSLLVDRTIGYSQNRYGDDDVYRAVDKSSVIAATGPRGTGYVVDTARCLHYGSRGNSRERRVFMMNYARKNCVNPGQGGEALDSVREQLISGAYRNDPARCFSLKPRAML